MTTITYHCPACQKFAEKKADYYDHSGAASCIAECKDCNAITSSPVVRWLDAEGRDIQQTEICMAVWPDEETV